MRIGFGLTSNYCPSSRVPSRLDRLVAAHGGTNVVLASDVIRADNP